ncbi:MAG: hypothetical protein H7308_13670 [Chthonomonadaceae bacterium]|nr:hypothetical protein [Chthonomonadaceae bacterium]
MNRVVIQHDPQGTQPLSIGRINGGGGPAKRQTNATNRSVWIEPTSDRANPAACATASADLCWVL